jgi:hypothetical protein
LISQSRGLGDVYKRQLQCLLIAPSGVADAAAIGSGYE